MSNLNFNQEIQVSVVIPMKNAEKYIGKTLQNILQQTQVSFEVIVVDDLSTDNSAEIVESFKDPRIKLIKGLGKGISEALNLGYSAALADIITRCDADDYFCPNSRLYQQVSFLENNPSYLAVCGNFSGMDQHDNPLGSFNCGESTMDITEQLKQGVVKATLCSYAIKKALFNKMGGFRAYFKTAEDVDFQLRIAEHTKVMYFAEQWYIYRLHAGSITHTQRENTRIAYEAAAKLFQKQRLSGRLDDLDLGIAKSPETLNDTSAPSSAKNHAIDLAIANSWQLHSQNKKQEAIKLLLTLFRKNPLSIKLLRHLILLAIK